MHGGLDGRLDLIAAVPDGAVEVVGSALLLDPRVAVVEHRVPPTATRLPRAGQGAFVVILTPDRELPVRMPTLTAPAMFCRSPVERPRPVE